MVGSVEIAIAPRRAPRWAYLSLRLRAGRLGGLDARPPLAKGERVLAGMADTAGAPVVATTAAIYLGGESRAWRRLGWVELASVTWDPRRGILRLVGLTEDEVYQVRLGDVRRPRLVALVREQFDASVLVSVPVSLAGGRTATVVARRVPGSREVTWMVWLRDGADADDPHVRERVAGAIGYLRAEIGL
jgi:hypothetical protein